MKFLLSLVLALLPATALGQIGSSNLGNELRTHDKLILGYALADATTSNTIGTRGVILASTAGTIGAATSLTVTSGFGVPPYAAKLTVEMHDAAEAGAVACSKVVIEGRNQFGLRVKSILLNVGEASTSTTNHAFERVDRLVATGCTGTAANDRIHVYVSDAVAVDRVLQSNADIVAVCQRDPNAAEFAVCVHGSVCSVDAFAGTVALNSCDGLGHVAGDAITIRTRTKWRGGGNPVYQR